MFALVAAAVVVAPAVLYQPKGAIEADYPPTLPDANRPASSEAEHLGLGTTGDLGEYSVGGKQHGFDGTQHGFRSISSAAGHALVSSRNDEVIEAGVGKIGDLEDDASAETAEVRQIRNTQRDSEPWRHEILGVRRGEAATANLYSETEARTAPNMNMEIIADKHTKRSPVEKGSNGRTSARSASKPNVFVILIDDMGWSDIGYQGTDVRWLTPNLDKLAAGGIKVRKIRGLWRGCSVTRYS